MSNKTFLSSEFMKNSKCSKCKKYLSIPPIYISSNDPICGRCVNNNKNCGGSRAHFYEDMAAFMFFPCINDINGCSVKTAWEEVLSHEVNCKFARITCPITGCDSKIGYEEVIHHCEGNHKTYVLSQNHFLISEVIEKCRPTYSYAHSSSTQENKLFIWNNEPFFIQVAVKEQPRRVFLRILSFNEATYLNFKCTLNGKGPTHSLSLNEFKIMRYSSKLPDYSANEEIDVGALEKILGREIRCTFTFEEKNKSSNFDIGNDDMLSELECPVCVNYMKPPIFMCSVGHSLCQECRKTLSKCPSCSTDLKQTRNYSLEKISEIVVFPCTYKNEGCGFQGNMKNTELHELHCPKSQETETNCYLSNTLSCTWSGSYAKAFEHISVSHPDHCVNLKHRLLLYPSTLTIKRLFLQYDKKVFELHINKNESEIEWAMYYFTNNMKDVQDKYMFYIDFVKNNKVFRFNEVCQPTVGNSCKQKNTYVNIPIHLINSFAQQSKVPFTVNIVKFR